MINWDDFEKIWARTSPLTPYQFSDSNYEQGWNFVGSTPPARQMWDSIQKTNDEKFKYLRDNFGTPNIVTQASQMTDTDKVYVYLGSEAGWNSGHWYYYDEGTSSWADGGVYNSVAFVTDTTLSIAGQPADAKATGDALALKSDLAGATFTGNITINADLSATGDATIGTNLSVTGTSTLTGNVSAGADLSVTGASTLNSLSVSGTTALTGTSTAPTPSAGDNSTKIATTQYVHTEIAPIETDVDIAQKDIANIKALLQGNMYNYQKDTSSAYTKTVPSGAMPYAGLETVGGKTIVWNQICKKRETIQTGITPISDTECTVDIEFTSVGYPVISNEVLTVTGHKYYSIISTSNSIPGTIHLYNNNKGISVSINPTIEKSSNVQTATGEQAILLRIDAGTYNTTLRYAVYDLTVMFGAGNEPTAAEFEAMFPALFYPFNAGGLMSAGVTEVESLGKNLLNPTPDQLIAMQKVGNTYKNTATDTKTAPTLLAQYYNGTTFVANTFNPFNVSTTGVQTVTFTTPTQTFNKIRIGHNGSAQDEKVTFSITLKPNTQYTLSVNITGVQPNVVGGFSFTDIQIEKGSPATAYKPYMNNTYSIPAEVQALEGYGWSVGSVYNYVDFERKVFVQNVGKKEITSNDVALVTAYTYNNITYFAVAKPTNYSGYNNYNGAKTQSPVVHSSFTPIDRPPTYNSVNNIGCVDGTANDYDFWFGFAKGTTLAQAQNVLAGTEIYYELATPIETDISAYLTDDNLIEVEAGGTLTFPNQNGDDYRIPVPSSETYMVDLQEAI